MKKVYLAPTVATYEICTDGMLALSKTDNVTLTNNDFGNGGNYEICTNKKEGIWGSQKNEGIWDSQQ